MFCYFLYCLIAIKLISNYISLENEKKKDEMILCELLCN